MTANQVGWAAAGLALLALSLVCWTGLWRWWAEGLGGRRAYPITLVPALGLIALVYGVSPLLGPGGSFAAFVIVFLSALVLLILGLTDPDWYGPSWYREYKRAFSGVGERQSWMLDDPRRSGESGVEATERHVSSERPAPPEQRVFLVRDPTGELVWARGGASDLRFYPQAPVLTAKEQMSGADKRTADVIIPAESIRGVQELSEDATEGAKQDSWRSGTVRILTTEGEWLFETRRPKRMVREIQRRYLG